MIPAFSYLISIVTYTILNDYLFSAVILRTTLLFASVT